MAADHETAPALSLLSKPIVNTIHAMVATERGLTLRVVTDATALLLADLPKDLALDALHEFVARYRISPHRANLQATRACLQRVARERWSFDRLVRKKRAAVAEAERVDKHRYTRFLMARRSADTPPPRPAMPGRDEAWAPVVRAALDVVFTAGSGLTLRRLDHMSITALRSMSCADAVDVLFEFASAYVTYRGTIHNVNKYFMGVVRNHMTRKSEWVAARRAASQPIPPSACNRSAWSTHCPSPPAGANPMHPRAPQAAMPRFPVQQSPSPVSSLSSSDNHYHPYPVNPTYPFAFPAPVPAPPVPQYPMPHNFQAPAIAPQMLYTWVQVPGQVVPVPLPLGSVTSVKPVQPPMSNVLSAPRAAPTVSMLQGAVRGPSVHHA